MTTKRFLSLTVVAVLSFLSAISIKAVDFRISDGIENAAVKAKIERTLSALLTELNSACEQRRNPNYAALHLSSEVETTISLLWDNTPFLCIDEELVEKCLKRSGGKYQIRNIPLLLKDMSEGEDYQEAVATFDARGNLLSFNLSISMNLYMEVLRQQLDVTDARYRELILDWTEQFRTAYNEHNLSFLRAVFSEDALIITGRVVERKTADGVRLPDEITYIKQTKEEYLTKLEQVFNRDNKNLIRVTFDEIEIMRHPNPEYNKIYGVTLHQEYRSGTYHDDGYLFLMWDFTNEDKPQIHVRTWQPDSYIRSKDDIIGVTDIDFTPNSSINLNK